MIKNDTLTLQGTILNFGKTGRSRPNAFAQKGMSGAMISTTKAWMVDVLLGRSVKRDCYLELSFFRKAEMIHNTPVKG